MLCPLPNVTYNGLGMCESLHLADTAEDPDPLTRPVARMTDRFHVRRHGRGRARASREHLADGRLEALLRALPPAPERLVARVLELPLLEGALAHLWRGRDPRPAGQELHEALSEVGLEPDAARVRMLDELRWQKVAHAASEKSPSEAPEVR
jgi:transposase InsO family protein